MILILEKKIVPSQASTVKKKDGGCFDTSSREIPHFPPETTIPQTLYVIKPYVSPQFISYMFLTLVLVFPRSYTLQGTYFLIRSELVHIGRLLCLALLSLDKTTSASSAIHQRLHFAEQSLFCISMSSFTVTSVKCIELSFVSTG